MLKIILNRLQPQAEEIIEEDPDVFTFRVERSTTEQMICKFSARNTCKICIMWTTSRENPLSEVFDQVRPKPARSATETSLKFWI